MFFRVADPDGALAKVAAAAQLDPMSGLTVVEATLPPNEHEGEVLMAPVVREPLRTGMFEISFNSGMSRAEIEAAFKRMFVPRTG